MLFLRRRGGFRNLRARDSIYSVVNPRLPVRVVALLIVGGIAGGAAPTRGSGPPPGAASSIPLRYTVAEIKTFDTIATSRAAAISESGQVVGQADAVTWVVMSDSPMPSTVDLYVTYSYFDPSAPYLRRPMIDIIGLIYLIANPRLIRDYYRGKYDKAEEAAARRKGWNPPVPYVSPRAFVIDAGKVRTPGGEAKPDSGDAFDGGSFATAVNRRGAVVGAARTSPYDPDRRKAFLYEPAAGKGKERRVVLGTLGGVNSVAYGINEAGQIVGEAEAQGGIPRAFLYEQGKMRDLGTLGGSRSGARAINERGQIVGWAETADGTARAFRWGGDRIEPLALPEGALSAQAFAVNAAGEAAGRVEVAKGVFRAAVWDTRGAVTVLPLPPGMPEDASAEAFALDNQGRIVGSVQAPAPEEPPTETAPSPPPQTKAVLWQAGRVYDLNERLPARSGWTLEAATGINDRGEIVGEGRKEGKKRAFRISPEKI
jgi:probable HAF family extracellular repeat protein